MEQWNNVELNDLSKKSYTLNHQFDLPKKNNNNEAAPEATPSNGLKSEDTAKPAENANGSEVLQPGSDIKPKVKVEDVEALVRRLYGITIADIKELISYDDRNYLIKEDGNIKNPIIVTHSPDGYVFKILNALDSKKTDFVDAQNQLLIFLGKQGIRCPKPIANVNGKHFSIEHINGTEHIVRLLDFIPGSMFHEVEKTNYLLYQSGEYLAKVDRALKNFNHDAYDSHKTVWMLQSVPQLRDFIYVVKDLSRKTMVEQIIETFENQVLSKLDTFEAQIIHGDYNEQNIIVDPPKEQNESKVIGIIDFMDTSKSPIIFEVGIALTYILLQTKNIESGGIFLAGYNSVRPINNTERQYLKYCVAARLAQSLVMGAYTYSKDPSNQYVLITQEEGWKLIQQLWSEKLTEIDELWQNAADKYLTQSLK